MRHEVYEAMQARLAIVRQMRDAMRGSPTEFYGYTERYREQEDALVDALVGDDPLVLASVNQLRLTWAENGRVMQRDERPDIRLSGNEVWVLADVYIGDDYGNYDFTVQYAISRNTGALYRMRHGEVPDDPYFVPEGSPCTRPIEPRQP